MSGDLAHGVVERQAESLDEKVDGIASHVAPGPTPVAVFDQQPGMGGQFEIAGGQLKELEAAFLKQRSQRGDPVGADLVAGPRRGRWSWRSMPCSQVVSTCPR